MRNFFRNSILSVTLIFFSLLFVSCHDQQDPHNQDQHSHEYGTDWEYDEHYHWQSCNSCGEKSSLINHTFSTRVVKTETSEKKEKYCTFCGYTEEFMGSDGIDYILNSDGKSYSVERLRSSLESDIVIAPYYKNLPVVSIEDNAFYYCDNIESITIPATIERVGQYAFFYCENITDVYFEGTIADWCKIKFADGYSTPMHYSSRFHLKNSSQEWEEVTSIKIDDQVEKIGDFQFFGFYNIHSITIGASVKSVGNYSFYNCNNLEKVYYEGTIADWCDIQFDLSYSTPMIYGRNFYLKNSSQEWEEVTSIKIPDGVTKVGAAQFLGFEGVTSVTISSSVKRISYNAFTDCNNLKDVYFEGTITDWLQINLSDSTPMSYAEHFHIKNDNDKWEELTSIEIPDGVTEIGEYQFWGFKNVTSITISDSVESIGIYAFAYCSSLTNVNIPKGLNKILPGVFYECIALENITIPSSVTTIEDDVFKNCGSLTNVYYNGTIADWCKIKFESSDSTPMSYAEHFHIKSDSDDWKEPTIIEIPDEVTEIGAYQFLKFANITSITIASSVKSIGYFAFAYCYKLTSLNIPSSVELIDDVAFAYCISLENITISSSLKKVGFFSFFACDNLKNVYYDGTIADWCNIDFYSLYSTPLNDGHFFMKNADGNWEEVTSIEIPEGVTTINKVQFYGFSNITSLTIPNSVTAIESYAFYNWNSLKEIYFKGTPRDWNKITIYEGNDSFYLARINYI